VSYLTSFSSFTRVIFFNRQCVAESFEKGKEDIMASYICVSGNIASGKTTLVQAFSEIFGWYPIYENLDSHPYFADFYSNMIQWSFHNQIYFLIEAFRIQSHISSLKEQSIVCQDFSIYERHLYTELLFEQGQMTSRDYITCTELFKLVLQFGKKPDCIIYLEASPDFLLKRVQKRGRKPESTIQASFLENLNGRYNEWFQKRLSKQVIKINIERNDLTNSYTINKLKNRILSKLEGRQIPHSSVNQNPIGKERKTK